MANCFFTLIAFSPVWNISFVVGKLTDFFSLAFFLLLMQLKTAQVDMFSYIFYGDLRRFTTSGGSLESKTSTVIYHQTVFI